MTWLWGGMIIISTIYGTLTGRLQEVTEAAVSSSGEAVALCVSMAGVTAFWSGLMKIAEMTGLVEQLSSRTGWIFRVLFPGLERESKACRYISLNFLSNCLGLGWAATPAGLKAMEELARLEKEKPTVSPGAASNAMCTFLIINVSSLQLIPVSLIAYRRQYGSVNPAFIAGPALLATLVSTGAAAVFCAVMNRRCRK